MRPKVVKRKTVRHLKDAERRKLLQDCAGHLQYARFFSALGFVDKAKKHEQAGLRCRAKAEGK